MDLKSFISIISNLNNGSVIYNHSDTETEIIINSSNIKLHVANNKYYFIAKYDNDFCDIEESLRDIITNMPNANIKPYNTYLILLYSIENFTEEVSKKVIKLEENEFFYKKYVFYYTNNEYNAFTEWYNLVENKTLSYILSNYDCSPLANNQHIDFLLRLVIKVPFINLVFKKMNMKNFDEILQTQLNGIKKDKQEILAMHDYLNECFSMNFEPVEIAEQIFSEISEVNTNEN